jgi:hypothetical protein
MSTFSDRAISFYESLSAPRGLPRKIQVMEPHKDVEVMRYTRAFLKKFFSDNRKRVLVLGINPGRFGSGMTGIPFTDPTALRDKCGIPNELDDHKETSSTFMYQFIDTWGHIDDFYARFFISAMCPLGFMKDGKNYNYYDDPILFKRTKEFIVATLRQQIDFGVSDTVIILGTGKNKKAFLDLNNELGLFKRVFAVEHPRFIMQYKRASMKNYLTKYKDIFTEALST